MSVSSALTRTYIFWLGFRASSISRTVRAFWEGVPQRAGHAGAVVVLVGVASARQQGDALGLLPHALAGARQAQCRPVQALRLRVHREAHAPLHDLRDRVQRIEDAANLPVQP